MRGKSAGCRLCNTPQPPWVRIPLRSKWIPQWRSRGFLVVVANRHAESICHQAVAPIMVEPSHTATVIKADDGVLDSRRTRKP